MENYIYVRPFDSSEWKKLTIEKWKEAEENAGNSSAFAETKDKNRILELYGSEQAFLEFLES